MNKQCVVDDCTNPGTEPMFDDDGPALCTTHESEQRWEAFRAHEIDAVMSGGQVDSPADWGLI